jgi:hypothetical protein
MDNKNTAEVVGTTAVATKGKHVVPNGVMVKELNGRKQKLLNECSPQLQSILTDKNLTSVYNTMIQDIVNGSKTRNAFLGKWNDTEIVSILEK